MSRKEIAYEIGQRIKTLRLSANMTQEELSTRLGHSSRSYISRIESGGRDIGQTEIVMLAKIFEVSPEFILCGTSRETTNRQNDPEAVVYILDPDEKRIIDAYRNFNKNGKEKLLDTVSDMELLPHYKKHNTISENVS